MKNLRKRKEFYYDDSGSLESKIGRPVTVLPVSNTKAIENPRIERNGKIY